MTLLVFGRTGQVATELARRASAALFLDRDAADLGEPDTCVNAIRTHAPYAVINAAAYTAVDGAEDNEALANAVNAAAPEAMARECAARDIPFVHISSDYVFDGSGTAPWRSDNETAPINAYGRSKLAGEAAITKAGGPHAILRTSWVFSAHGNNFVRTMLRLAQSRNALNIVDDQIGGPTPAANIATATLVIARQLQTDTSKTGIYHYSGAPDVSWKGFAEAIFAFTGSDITVTGIETADYPTLARRPLNSRLDCATTHSVFDLARPEWRSGLLDVLTELGEISQ